MARAAAHQALGARGSRVALYDLREALESKLDPLPLGMLVALGQVGDTSCLEPLAAAAGRTASDWQRDHLLDAARRIVRRERLTRRQAVVRRLVARHPWLALAFE
jgi:HEAT repeat protein